MKPHIITAMLVVAVLSLLVAVIATTVSVSGMVLGKAHKEDTVLEIRRALHLDLVEILLKNTHADTMVQFSGDKNVLFKSANQKIVASRSQNSTPSAIPARPDLSLKAILVKKKECLAVIEVSAGQTVICAVGDTISACLIQRITSESVFLRDRRGVYELTVKDQ